MQDDDHGHSRAAWIGVGVMLVSVLAGCYGVVFGPDVLLWIGLVGFAVGALGWYALARVGSGSETARADASRA